MQMPDAGDDVLAMAGALRRVAGFTGAWRHGWGAGVGG